VVDGQAADEAAKDWWEGYGMHYISA
jgi:hypothetical protein